MNDYKHQKVLMQAAIDTLNVMRIFGDALKAIHDITKITEPSQATSSITSIINEAFYQSAQILDKEDEK